MKRIGIISDTHGYLDTIDLALDATMDQDIDMWLHAGDYGDDARRVEYQPNPIIANDKNLREFRGLIVQEVAKYSNARIVIDAGGSGLELYKMLEEDGLDVVKVNWGSPCFKQEYKNRFFNQRACAMVRWRDATRQMRVRYPTMDNLLREKFLNQASRIPYGFTETGAARYKILGKDEMRRRGIKSPDMADAMSFAFLDNVYYNVSDAYSGSLNEENLIAAALAALAE